jgi:hypothetical protein
VLDPVHFFWCVVAILAVAATCNHRWHHARHNHPATRLTRAPHRAAGSSLLPVERRPRTRDVDL